MAKVKRTSKEDKTQEEWHALDSTSILWEVLSAPQVLALDWC